MSKLAMKFAINAMQLADRWGLNGVGADFGASSEQLSTDDPSVRFRQANFEKEGIGQFYLCFPDLDEVITGNDVLDFGCGYGGKTVEYARKARSAAGVEPFPTPIKLATAYAAGAGCENVSFRVCTQDHIPFPDESFDVVLSHDVLEHVADPSISLREIHRVLRAGGTALLAFPPYDGMLSHHLDYVCRLPGLHWVFGPKTLVAAANEEIERRGLTMHRQPDPLRSWDRSRFVLPALNGMTSAQFRQLAKPFASVEIDTLPVAKFQTGAVALARDVLRRILPADYMTSALLCRLRKAG